MENLKKEIIDIINKNSFENNSNTPDFILGEYLIDSLLNFDKAVAKRELYYSHDAQDKPNEEYVKSWHKKPNQENVKSWHKKPIPIHCGECSEVKDIISVKKENLMGEQPQPVQDYEQTPYNHLRNELHKLIVNTEQVYDLDNITNRILEMTSKFRESKLVRATPHPSLKTKQYEEVLYWELGGSYYCELTPESFKSVGSVIDFIEDFG